ncbi:MAG: BspA family leucine-rich repeat surface protein, partial [Prevotella sp.]|nr:BspA family leucine-rich repeat surface protein [Prevotella sp.]
NAMEWVGEVYSDCEKVVFTPSFKQARPTSCRQWFLGFSQLTTIEGIENLNTEEVTDMSEMFNSCSGLKNLDLSSFNTAKVTDMGYMFGGCYDLISLDLSSFNTAKVTDMTWMFYNCQSLTTIYASDGFTTGEVSSSDGMFESCFTLEGATPWDITKTGIDMANYTSGYFKTYFTLGENKVELCGNPLTTKILDLSGDYDFTPKYDFKAASATYTRDLSTSESTWFSLCLPFAYTPDNFTAYQLKGATAEAVEIEEITGEIVAGTPVLFKFKDSVVDKTINLSATEAEIVKAPVDGAGVDGNDGSSLQLCGTYQAKTFSSEDNNAFILLNDKLMNPAKILATTGVAEDSVKPFCAYMTLTASEPQSARVFSIGRGDEGGGTTAIDLLNSVATDDAEYYDINGRRIDAPAKGVNIVRRGNTTIKLIIK